ncbi:MAG TPA: DUF3048 domain-containing protein [Acidimicrobiales bacterium]|jgi:hypothetical protein|nr:DUF3048 domain-containing protein [Acidimicrobiales bacterium]
MPSVRERFEASKATAIGWYTGPHGTRTKIISAAVVVLAALAIGFGLRGGKPASVRRPPPTSTTIAPIAVKTSRCPLTDVPPAVGDTVPRRPALLVKIGNEPNARPQSGLNEADVVFDTPAEGFIMRYVAVFQCNDAGAIGPTRSVRWVDWNMIARQFVSPILAFAGGIDPNVNGVMATPWISPANLLEGGQEAGHRISSRSPPDNLYTSTAGLYGLYKSKTTPPPAIFVFGATLPPGARPAKAIEINFSGGTDVIWKWDPTSHTWLHTYLGAPDVDTLTGKQVATSNIVVEIAQYSVGPYIESAGGSGDIESELLGSGSGYVLRQGAVTPVTWHRPTLLGPTTFTNPAGQPVTLIPGRTWVEIVPSVQAAGISVTP